MAAKRLWYFIFGIAAFLALFAVVPAQGNNDDSDGINAREAELLADFLILAVKPEGDERDYKLVEIGDTKINAGLLGVVVNTLPLDFLGLGSEKRDYNEAAEIAQCRAACRANTACRDFAYVRPNANQPVGVCHLKRPADAGEFGVMTPVVDERDRRERPIREPRPSDAVETGGATIVLDGRDTTGRVRYGEDARVSPITLKFNEPVATAKVFVRPGAVYGDRLRATVETFDANGKSVERTGTWISTASETNFGHAIVVGSGDSDRITTIKITATEAGALLLDGIEFTRTLFTPPVVAETPIKPEAPREKVPPPPRLPPLVAEYFPLPPRAVPTAPPTDITIPRPAEPLVEPTVETAPPTELAETPPPPVEPPVVVAETPPAAATPAQPVRKRGLPLWLALGAIAVMTAGAGVYWRNHRARTINRLTTRLVSTGLDRQTITIDTGSDPEHSLRVVVRAPANANARIELIPKGASA